MRIKSNSRSELFDRKSGDESHAWLLSDNTELISATLSVAESNPETLPLITNPEVSIGVQPASPIAWDDIGQSFCYVNSGHQICVVDVEDEYRLKMCLSGHHSTVTQLLFQSSSILLSCSKEGLFLWDLQQNGKCVHLIPEPITCMCLVFDHSILACGTTNGQILIFDAQDQYCQLDSLSSHKHPITYLYYISTRNILSVASRDSTITLWNLQCYQALYRSFHQSPELLFTLHGRHGDVTCLTATSDGCFLLSGGRDNSIGLWNVNSGKFVRYIEDVRSLQGKHRGEITYLRCVQNDEKLLTASHDGLVKCFRIPLHGIDLTDPLTPLTPLTPLSPLEPLDSLQDMNSMNQEDEMGFRMQQSVPMIRLDDFMNDHRSLTSLGKMDPLNLGNEYENSDTLVWSVDIGQHSGIARIEMNPNIAQIAVSFNSPQVQVYSMGQLDWETWHSSPLLSFSGHANVVTCLDFDNTCCLLSGSRDHHVIFREMTTFSQIHFIDVHSAVNALCCVNEWSFIASSDYRILAYSTEKQVYLVGHVGQVTSLAYIRAQDFIVSGSYSGAVILHHLPSSLEDEPPCFTQNAHSAMVTTIDSICLEGVSLVASGGADYTVIVYRVTGASLSVLWRDTQETIITGVLFGVGNGVGLLYVVNQSGHFQIWDISKASKVSEFHHHSSKIVGLCQSQDGQYVITAGNDRQLFVYDVSEGMKCVKHFMSDEIPSAVAFYGGKVVCGYTTGDVRLWRIQ